MSLRGLLASSSAAALLIGAGMPAAWAACATTISGNSAGFSNPSGQTIPCVTFNGATVSGSVGNAGTITPGAPSGILVTNNSTIAGGITNTGAITITGGTAIQVNSGLISGGVSNSGTITASGSGIVLFFSPTFASSFSGNVTNSGTIRARQAMVVGRISTFAGGIANSGTLVGTGGGGMVVVGINTLAGGVANSGTVTGSATGMRIQTVSTFTGGVANSGFVSTGGAIGLEVFFAPTFTGGVTNSGTIAGAHQFGIFLTRMTTFSGGVTNSGVISNMAGSGIFLNAITAFSGGITNSGTITASLAGIGVGGVGSSALSTFTGGISNTGTITAGVGISVAGGVAAAPVSIFDSGTIISTGTNAVDLSAANAGNTFTLGPGYAIVGRVQGQGSDTFQLGGTGSSAFDLATVGPAQQYRGFTTFNVVSGTWTVSNTFGQAQSWNVNGGTLAGTGTLPGVNVNAGGTLLPGNIGSPGTAMTISGNLAFAGGAHYAVQLNPTTSTRANVGGTATLAGDVQGALAPGVYSSSTTYTILHSGGRSGTFSGFSSNMPGFTGTLSYTSTDVLLNLQAGLGLGGGLNQNQQAVADAINGFFNGGGTLPAGFSQLFGLSGQNLGNALTQLSGEAAADSAKGAFDFMTQFLGLMIDPALGGRDDGGIPAPAFAPERTAGLPPDVALAYASVLKAPAYRPVEAPRWRVWGGAFGGTSSTDGNASVGSNAVVAREFGVAAGVDYRLSPATVVGFALAGGGTDWGLAQNLGGGRSDAFAAGLHARSYFGPAYLAGALAFANHWMTTDRTALADRLEARFAAQSYGGRLEGGYRIAWPSAVNVGITPYAALQSQVFATPAYSETDLTGGGFGLSFASMHASDTRSELGARFDGFERIGNMPLVLRGRLAWAHDWVTDPRIGAVFATLPGASFVVLGAAPAKNSALASAGAELAITDRWSASVKFDGTLAEGQQTYAGTGRLRYTW